MRSGERCDKCDLGRLRVYCSRTVGMARVRFLKCSSCGATGQETARVDDLGRTILGISTRPSTATPSESAPPRLPFTEATLADQSHPSQEQVQ